MERVEVDVFLNNGLKNPLIDVRSPAEFLKGHIPGAVNIPIFDDLERAKVGTVYKQQSREEAIALGLELVGPKMSDFAAKAKEIANGGVLNVYCWRGGMRSEKMAWLFELVGLETRVLKDGYKAYRKHLHCQFEKLDNLIIIQGPTGSGKTKILHALAAAEEQVIDLEGLANHKGSVFGGLGEEEQPTTQQFQNDILATMSKFDLQKSVWIESESATVGRVYLPEELWKQMNKSRVIILECPREHRVKHIIEQYGEFNADELSVKIEQLAENIGSTNIKIITDFVQTGNLPAATDLLLKYYDKSYGYSASKYKTGKSIKVTLDSMNWEISAQTLINKLAETSI